MKLHDILLNKARKSELAHFYILETSAEQEKAFDDLIQFVTTFIRDYYQKVEGQKASIANLMDHPDVFVMGNVKLDDEAEDKFFKVEEAQELARFFEFKAVQSKQKFAVITEGHRINTIVANKWLKLLEEPQGQATIFLLNPRGGQLLPTIHSRAIHLRLPTTVAAQDFSEWNEFITATKEQGLADFLETHQRQSDLGFWVNELVRWEAEQTDQIAAKYSLEGWLKAWQEMETFHQPGATKWTLFYHHLRDHVLPRIS